MHADGKFHYGASTLPAPQAGPLFEIAAHGAGKSLPKGPNNPAEPEEHQRWLASLQRNGFDVRVVLVDEPAL
jgi:hypothetical protein